MYLDAVDKFADLAAVKADAARSSPVSYFLGSVMAGAYVGLGAVLIFCLGADMDPSVRRLVMGMAFGGALVLVIFAGSELFTGLTMLMTLGCLRRRARWSDLGLVWTISWLGNFAGSALVAALFASAGGANILFGKSTLLADVAAMKMNAAPAALFARAILCNWLVCLAIWMSMRMNSDAAKCIAMIWCVLAFVASGYEHVVANMGLLILALLGNHPGTVTVGGLFYNLLWVTLGNVVGGAVFTGVGYWFVSRPRQGAAVSSAVSATAAI